MSNLVICYTFNDIYSSSFGNFLRKLNRYGVETKADKVYAIG